MVPEAFIAYVSEPISRHVPVFRVEAERFTISVDEALQDLKTFQYIMDNAYSGKEYWENHGISFEAAYQTIRNFIESNTEKVFISELCENYYKAFENIHDGHLSFCSAAIGMRSFDKKYQAYFSDIIVEKKEEGYVIAASAIPTIIPGQIVYHEQIQNMLFPTLSPTGKHHFLVGIRSWKPESELLILLDGKPQKLPLHPCRAGTGVHHDYGVFTYEKRYDHHIVHSSRFWDGEEIFKKDLSDQFAELGRSLNDKDHVIWDIAHNSGGSSAYPQSFIYGLNSNALWPVDCAVLTSPPILQCQGKWTEGMASKREWAFYPAEKRNFENSTYDGVLYVIISDNVGSSGEAAVSMAMNVKKCILIGQNTGGRGTFGDTLHYRLPFSHMVMTVPYKLFLGGAEEGKGYTPDFWVDAEDLLEEVILWLNDPDRYCAIR